MFGRKRRVVDLELEDAPKRRLEDEGAEGLVIGAHAVDQEGEDSSRLPAVLKARLPIPRMGLEENPVCEGATDPGTRRPRSVKWRPFSGIC